MIPELSWIALLHDKYGTRHAVELLGAFGRTMRSIGTPIAKMWLGPSSNYRLLSDSDWERLRAALAGTGELFQIQAALDPLISLYPECPLAKVFAAAPSTYSEKAVGRMKMLVGSLLRRADRDPTMVQASALWLAFDSEILKVAPETSLAKFPEIQRYPDTPTSREVGAAIRASLNAFFGMEMHYPVDAKWPAYFWNRGLAISPCESPVA